MLSLVSPSENRTATLRPGEFVSTLISGSNASPLLIASVETSTSKGTEKNVSPPAENAFLGWHAAAKGLTGYLFWAFNTWVANPLQDSRWHRYPAGTLFQFYPGPRTSIRFEKMIEGIQDFEKIRILREQFTEDGNDDGLRELDRALSLIKIEELDSVPAAEMVEKAKAILNQF